MPNNPHRIEEAGAEQERALLIEALIAAAWRWGHDCNVDDIHDRQQTGDSHNEAQRAEVTNIAAQLDEQLSRRGDRIAELELSRANTRAALETMRAERDALRAHYFRLGIPDPKRSPQ